MVQHSELHVVPCYKPHPFIWIQQSFNGWLIEYGII